MPPLSRMRKNQKEDAKSLASDMCPNGASDAGFRTRDVIVWHLLRYVDFQRA